MPRLVAILATLGVSLSLLMLVSAQDNPEAETEVAQKTKGKKKANPKKRANPVEASPNADFIAALIDVAAERGASVLSTGDAFDDFASLARTSDGTLYVAYTAYFDGHDQVRIHRQLDQGRWSTYSPAPLAQSRADIWMPQLAVDKQDRVWLIWSEQTGQTANQSGNWDIYARPLVGARWGALVRLTDDPKPDINPHVATDSAGRIHVVWQAHPENSGDIQYCRLDGDNWSKPLAITADNESDWYPHVAVDAAGTAWIAFDSYRNGDYDVFLTSVRDGKLGEVTPIATSTFYEAHASVACGSDGRVWVAWEQGGHNWGKDQGYWLKRENRDQGTTLGSRRDVKVACYYNGQLLAAPDVATCLPEDERVQATAHAELAVDPDNRLWLRFRHMTRGRDVGRRFRKGWTENVTHLASDGWQPAFVAPASAGRISVFSRILPGADGALTLAYSADARSVDNYHRPIQDTVLVTRVERPAVKSDVPQLEPYQPPSPPAAIPAWNSALEQRQVAAVRDYRTTIDGAPHQIVRGDLHRHTELSWDVGPGNDGSYLDFYRYMIDVASMDFGSLTDHQGGGHYAYWWWLTEKSADLYYLPPRFVPLYGYERSVRFPNGHRNIFHAERGVPVVPFHLKLDQTGVFPGVGTGEVVENDTKLLYEMLHRTGGIAISHTSGTSSMGTDWRDNDPVVEPVVEIYQGARNSYEAPGAPRVHSADEPPDEAPGGFQEAGLLWKAYEKGYRLGTTASSDHGSTHISYSLVYTPTNDRAAILDSIRKRHTYGATDNLIVELQVSGHFMGDEFELRDNPQLTLKVQGTAEIESIDVIRNNRYVHQWNPGDTNAELQYVDMQPERGTNMYYCRVLQKNGEVAWSSPVWVNFKQ